MVVDGSRQIDRDSFFEIGCLVACLMSRLALNLLYSKDDLELLILLLLPSEC